MRDYSQFGEQLLISNFFESRKRKKGRFLDIGAHDGMSCSNTLALAEAGWGGVLVEPSPIAFTKLISTYADRPDIEFVNAAIAASHKARLVHFYEGGGTFVGTLDDKHRDAWAKRDGVQFRNIWTNALGFTELFEALPGPYHFVSIDTEGTNLEVLEALLKEVDSGFELICVEKDNRDALFRKLTELDKWRVYAETVANVLLVRL